MTKLTTLIISLLLAFGSLGATYRLSSDSQVKWSGKKRFVGGGHWGTIAFSGGTVEFRGEDLAGGSFTVDMRTIGSGDLSGSSKKNLDDHLKSDDFFAVASHPEASFAITGVEKGDGDGYKVTGNLTVRGKTAQESFDVRVSREGGNVKAVGKLVFDRTKYDVKHNSGKFLQDLAKDKIIHDDIELEFDISAEPVQAEASKG